MNKKQTIVIGAVLIGGAVWYFTQSGGFILAKPTQNQLRIERQLVNALRRDYPFLTPAQVAGIVGNLSHETGGFRYFQEINPTQTSRPGVELGGAGYAQWTGSRRRTFFKWAAERGFDVKSFEANYGFLRHEFGTPDARNVLQAIRVAQTPEEAADIFEDKFLRAGILHSGRRRAHAVRIFGRITGGIA